MNRVPDYAIVSVLAQTLIAWPEMLDPALAARKRAVAATSSAVTKRRSETLASMLFSCALKETPTAFALAAITRSMRGPATGPGWMALTRILAGPRSMARLLVKATTSHFEDE